MLQVFLLFLVVVLFITVRHFWRNRQLYGRLISLFSNLGQAKPGYGGREKKITACPHCGSSPEIGGDPCSSCGRIV